MNKTLSRLALAGTAFTVALPVSVLEVSAKNYLNEGRNSLNISSDESEGVFNSRSKERAEWYSSKGQNRVYKTYRNYFYFYSPVRPRDVKRGVADYSGLYENWVTRNSLNEKSWDTRNMLVSRDPNNSKYNQNFKTQAKTLKSVQEGKGGSFEKSKNVDKFGQFAGINGEWRHLGYSMDGTTIGNPLFPEDYLTKYNALSYSYVVKPWDKNDWSKQFVPGSSYDVARANASTSQERDRYKAKLDAINKLRKQSPIMATKSASWWMDRLSLTSDPIDGTAVFRGAWVHNDGARRYVEWTLVNDENPRNLMVEEMTVKRADNGSVVAKFNRNKPEVEEGVQSYYGDKKLFTGTAYNIEVKVKNLSNKRTSLNQSEVEIGYKEKYNPKTSYPADFKGSPNGNEFNQRVTGARIPKNGSRTFTLKNVVFPDKTKDTTVRLSTMIGAGHRKAQDNLNTIDDIGVLPINVVGNTGDMEAQKVELIDEKGNVVSNPIPGESYKVRYTYKYNGPDIRKAKFTARKDNQGNSWQEFTGYEYPNVTMTVKSSIKRTLPGKSGNKLPEDTISENITLKSTIKNGKTYSFTTPKYQVYEVPKLTASGAFSIDKNYSEYNRNGSNDSVDKTWNQDYDYSVKDLQIIPRTERTPVDGKMNVAVSFTAVQSAPKIAKDAGFEQAVDMKVTVNGKNYFITEHLKNGENKNIVMEAQVDANVGKPIVASVHVNDTGQAWEKDLLKQDNNKASTMFTNSLVNKGNGFSNDKNKNTSGFATNHMLFPTDKQWVTNTSNSWKQDYEVRSVAGKKVSYKTASGNTNSFIKHRNESSTKSVVDQNESYKIDEVLFRSKYTKDNKLGDKKDGWVSMVNAKKLPRIKAGYGYELKVNVSYKTNALSNQPKKSSIQNFSNRGKRNGKAEVVRPYNVAPNIPNDLFVKTPDGKTLSVSGSRGTTKGLTVKRTGTPSEGKWEFTLKPSNTLGVKEEGKIYIGENVKDGEYGIQVWTPVINGIPTKNLKTLSNGNTEYTPSQLADFRTFNFEVKGSATDDLVDSIIQ